MKIIDCSIRDGGHINKWHFDESLVKASYFAASNAQVDYFEIGYKNDNNIIGLGEFGYCREEYINSLFKSLTDCKLLCMIDAGKYTNYKIPKCRKELTPFVGIRVAAYPYEAKQAINLIEKLFDKGYLVFLQLMASSEWKNLEMNIIENWKNRKFLEAVYFADSFGSYIPSDISKYIRKLKHIGFKNIGFHSHNNLQMAFANALQAINDGVGYVDASIYGMGRGAGNLPIEILLNYLQTKGDVKYNVVPYLDVIDRFYLKLKDELKWGYSLKTLLSGGRNIHPYYVDELIKTGNFTIEEIWNVLDHIKQDCPISFNKNKLDTSLQQRLYVPSRDSAKTVVEEIEEQVKLFPSKDAFHLKDVVFTNKHKNKRFLIIANGPTIKKYKKTINKLIKKEKLVTIGCNYLEGLYKPNYHIFVSKKRFLRYSSTVDNRSILLIPSYFGKNLVNENFIGKREYIEIALVDRSEHSLISDIVQNHAYLNVGVAAILTAIQMGAKEILVVGMDGYKDKKTKEIQYFYNEDGLKEDKEVSSKKYENFSVQLDLLSDYLVVKGIPLFIITPTSHIKFYKNLLKINNKL
ncbi:MAG: hypothetical protein WAV51_02815 [Microgenomates group bacterium]